MDTRVRNDGKTDHGSSAEAIRDALDGFIGELAAGPGLRTFDAPAPAKDQIISYACENGDVAVISSLEDESVVMVITSQQARALAEQLWTASDLVDGIDSPTF